MNKQWFNTPHKGMTLLVATFLFASAISSAADGPLADFQLWQQHLQQLYRAPLDRNVFLHAFPGQPSAQQISADEAGLPLPATAGYKNVKVTQDRNPWPKAGVAAAVDPSSPARWVVMSNDFRVNLDGLFFHVSTDDGQTWFDDALAYGGDLFGNALAYQKDPGVAFDGLGNSYFSALNGAATLGEDYMSLDTAIDLVQGSIGGTYGSQSATTIDLVKCHGQPDSGVPVYTKCTAVLDKPSITIDNNPGSPRNGTTYIYYTRFDGTSSIYESHSAGRGKPFSAPALVSGSKANAQFSSMVIDASGTPHIFFDDFTNAPRITMWEATPVSGTWVVGSKPVVSFVYTGLKNPNWAFADAGSVAPGCGIYRFAAYCAFSANQIESGPVEATPSVYVVALNPRTQVITQIARVNNDAFNGQKHHFFPWAAVTPRQGILYVGWYDDRNDRFNTKVEYFVAKSYDGGKTFPKQQAVSDVSFNPCVGYPGCAYFGDYNQLVSGPDGIIHAAWADTRDGASMQIWSQVITW